jgi:hypothetical protein
MPNATSLHIGLNAVDPGHYDGWSGPLTACEADASDMAQIATSLKYAGTQVLLTADATRSKVIGGIKRAAEALAAGDLFLLTYSGHGGQVPDTDDDDGEEDDLQDETWCLYDGQLIDDELRELWAAFRPGARILVLSDSCHSGTVVRAAYDRLAALGATAYPVSRSHEGGPRFRSAPDEVLLRTFRKNQQFYVDLARRLPKTPSTIGATVRLISGCQDNQLSMDGTFNGAFTGALLQVWANGAFQGNYDRFHRQILKHLPPTQSPNHMILGAPNPAYDAQRPFEL